MENKKQHLFALVLGTTIAINNSFGENNQSADQSEKKRPNIIFLMDDQHRYDAIGLLNKKVITPTLDSLISHGVLYTEAVCQAPMSVASRNSMMTGLYPNQIGILRNEPGISEDKLPSKPIFEVLRDAGYETAGFGKTHWGLDTESTRGFETRYEAECRENGAIMMVDVDAEKYKKYNEEVKPFGPGEEDNAGYIGLTSKLNENEHRDGWLTEKCIDYVRERKDDRPLFLYLSFFKPHAGNNILSKFESMYDLKKIPYAIQPPWDKDYSPHAEGVNRRKIYEGFWKTASVNDWKTMTMRYYANCTWMDDMFGRVLSELKTKGVLDNAIIVYLTDHGEMLGDRYYRFNKYCLYDGSVRVPIVISGSALPAKLSGKKDSRPAELVDIYPTLLNIAGVEAPKALPGINLLSNQKRSGNFCGLYERAGEAAFMWRTKDFKLILCFKRKKDVTQYSVDDIINGEFYDLKKDPREWNNCFKAAKYNKVREQMRDNLLEHLKKIGKLSPGAVAITAYQRSK